MADQKVPMETIDEFLAQKRMAMAGMSRERKDFIATLFEEFCRRGYAIVPAIPMRQKYWGDAASPARK